MSLFISTGTVTVLALLVIVRPEPWYSPRYAIPLLGMMAGNCMSGIALGLNHLTTEASRSRGAIEARLALGEPWSAAIADHRKEAIRTGMIPIINAMAAAGLISLPGMLTGQILAGNSPSLAVMYQILIMFMISSATGFGVLLSVFAGARRLFDERERFRPDRMGEVRHRGRGRPDAGAGRRG